MSQTNIALRLVLATPFLTRPDQTNKFNQATSPGFVITKVIKRIRPLNQAIESIKSTPLGVKTSRNKRNLRIAQSICNIERHHTEVDGIKVACRLTQQWP